MAMARPRPHSRRPTPPRQQQNTSTNHASHRLIGMLSSHSLQSLAECLQRERVIHEMRPTLPFDVA